MEHSETPPVERVRKSLSSAAEYAWALQHSNGNWCGELKSNATITAEQILLMTSLGHELSDKDRVAYRRYFLGEQQTDGSWALAPDYPGDISISCEAYLALKILGMSTDSPEMQKARDFILASGGVAKVRIFTRIYFAQFGLFPWQATPELPAELILVPPSMPLNLFKFSSWARSTVVPLLIICHHRPIYPLPNGGASPDNDFLDELWLDPSDKMVPLPTRGDVYSLIFGSVNTALGWLSGLRWSPTRRYALRKCVDWILERQEPNGDWAGIIPPMHFGVQALLLEGFGAEDARIRRAMAAIEDFHWQDESGKRLQSCVSPVWDTVLMTRALCDTGVVPRDEARLKSAIQWVLARQHVGEAGDWRVYCSAQTPPGGFAFEYHNTWYPDVDDTAAAILATLSQDPSQLSSDAVRRAALWICGMQSKDHGWAAFDLNNDALWINRIPFSDMDSMCDPPTSDITGRVLECFGLMLRLESKGHRIDAEVLQQIEEACRRGIGYLAKNQEVNGSWRGRWGCNYLYGTSNVLCGLAYFGEAGIGAGTSEEDEGQMALVQRMAVRGRRYLKRVQNVDGGWGESLLSYREPWRSWCGTSTPSQTAWALMGLMAGKCCTADDPAIAAGVLHLLDTQTDEMDGTAASWPEKNYTGVGFPNFFYIGYTLYRHYFPMMALGRYLQVCEA